MRWRKALSISAIVCLSAVSLAAWASTGATTYGPTPIYINYTGASIQHEPNWDRYLMFMGVNSSVVDGKPSN